MYEDTEVAIKRVRISTSADLESFRQELRLMAAMDHPNIVRLLAAKALPPGVLLWLKHSLAYAACLPYLLAFAQPLEQVLCKQSVSRGCL